MPKDLSIFKNTIFLMAGTVIQRFLSFFTMVLITRYLGPKQYGQLIFIIALVTIVAVFWEFGLNTLLVRDVSRDKDLTSVYTGNILTLKTVLLVIIFPVMVVYLKLLEYNMIIIESVIYFALGSFVFSLSGVFESVFSAWKRFDLSSILNVTRATLLLGLVIIIIESTSGLKGVVLGYVLSFVGVFILSIIILKMSFVMPSFNGIGISIFWNLIKTSSPYLITSVVTIILFRIDHLMLSKMSGDMQLGLYGAAYTLFEIIIGLFPMMITRSTFPVLCQLYSTDIDAMVVLYKQLNKLFFFIGVPISCGTILLGPEFITIIYGNDYKDAGILLSVLGVAMWVFFMTNLMCWTLTAMNRQMLVLFSGIMAMIGNIIINFVVIPIMGALGSAYATLFCELMQLVFLSFIIWKLLRVGLFVDHIKIIVCALIMSLLIVLLKEYIVYNEIIKLIIIVTTSVVIYLVLALVTHLINLKEINQMVRSW